MTGRRSNEKTALGAAAALFFTGALGSACSAPPAQVPAPSPVPSPRAPIAPLALPVGDAMLEAVVPRPIRPGPPQHLLPAVDFYGHEKVLGWNGLEIDLHGASERASQLMDCSPAGLDDHDVFWMAGPGGLQRAHPFLSSAPSWSLPVENDPRGHTLVSGRMVAVFDGAKVAISHDGARTFARSIVEPGLSIGQVFLRSDGVVVVRGQRGDEEEVRTFVSRPGGGGFRPSELEPRRVVQNGAWIWNGDADCPAVLSRDGQRWTRDPDALAPLLQRQSWARSLEPSSAIRGFALQPRITAEDPPPPPAPPPRRAIAGQEDSCDRRGRAGAPCAIDCLRTTASRLLLPGSCAARDGGVDGECRPDAAWIAPPRLDGIDAPLPGDCRRGKLASAHEGSDDAALICDAGGHAVIHSLSTTSLGWGKGTWTPEGSLSWSAESTSDRLVRTLDGGLVLESRGCEATPRSGCAIAVKRPKSQAWREVSWPGASQYWVFEHGVIAVRVETEGKLSRVALGWIPDEGPAVTLIEGIQVEDLIAVLLVDGAVEVAVEAAMQKIRLVVMADGSLVAR